MWGLTRTLGHTHGFILVLGIGVALQFECVLVVDEGLRTQRHARARIVEVPAHLLKKKGHIYETQLTTLFCAFV